MLYNVLCGVVCCVLWDNDHAPCSRRSAAPLWLFSMDQPTGSKVLQFHHPAEWWSLQGIDPRSLATAIRRIAKTHRRTHSGAHSGTHSRTFRRARSRAHSRTPGRTHSSTYSRAHRRAPCRAHSRAHSRVMHLAEHIAEHIAEHPTTHTA